MPEKETFSWKVQWGMTTESEQSGSVLKLGDGYEQRLPSGLNSFSETYNVVVRLNRRDQADEIKKLKAFIRKHLLIKSFRWTPPDEDREIFVVCDQSSSTNNGVYVDFELTFRQVFN